MSEEYARQWIASILSHGRRPSGPRIATTWGSSGVATCVALLMAVISMAARASYIDGYGGIYNDIGNGIDATCDAVYQTGSFASPSVAFGPYTVTNAAGNGNTQDIMVWRSTMDGTVLWAKSFGGTLNDYGRSVAVDRSTEQAVYVTGAYASASISKLERVLTCTRYACCCGRFNPPRGQTGSNSMTRCSLVLFILTLSSIKKPLATQPSPTRGRLGPTKTRI